MRTTSLLSTLLFGGVALGAPRLSLRSSTVSSVLAQDAIETILPTSNTCSGAAIPDECRTAAQAAPYVAAAFDKYECNTNGEMAALLSWMGLESVDFKYKHNVSPGVAGQGTADMQSPTYNTQYATYLFGASAVANKDATEILALVTPDDYNFGSAAWFLTTQCASAQATLQTSPDEGWSAFMACVGVSVTDDRTAYWTRAKTVYGLS